MMRWGLLCLTLFASHAQAFELAPANGTEVARDESPADSVRLPRGAWQDGVVFQGTEGAIRRRAFQVPNPALTTLQLAAPLRDALEADGYEPVFSCADQACGGFDFRFQLDLLPPPAMFVDLGNFRYVLMESGVAEAKLVSIVTSSSATSGYVHITEVYDTALPDPPTVAPDSAPVIPEAADLITTLVDTGHVVLGDLEFAIGSAELGVGPFPSLNTLANWLEDTPGARVVLVGHTDSIGALDANLALSRRRASSVLARLVDGLGVDASQVFSDGAGALSPIAPNLTPEGRALNRRVEVVLLTIE